MEIKIVNIQIKSWNESHLFIYLEFRYKRKLLVILDCCLSRLTRRLEKDPIAMTRKRPK